MKTRKRYSVAAVCVAAACTISMGASSAMPVLAAAKSSDTVQKYEFENGSTSGGKIYNEGWKGNTEEDGSGEDFDLTNASGGFSYLDQKGTTVSLKVTVEEAGLYEMKISYCEPYDKNKKVQYLNVNGVNQGEVSFSHNLKFEETSGGVVMLNAGENTIELSAYWGYTFFDYLTIQPADESLTNLSPTRTLSNPNASDSTKRLYQYLCDQYGKHIISGQQEYCGSHNYNLYADPTNFIKDNEQEFEYLEKTTGKMCAIRGIDFLNYRSNATWDDNAAERTIQWVNEYKGIAALVWHWSVPSEEGSTDCNFYVESANANYTTFSISRALEEGTWENKVLMADIAEIAKQLKKLKDADVPVLWRPLHEAEGAWFWWGADGAEPCVKLWKMMFDYFRERNINNLIWVWTSQTKDDDWYPGDEYVDMIGRDLYNYTTEAAAYDFNYITAYHPHKMVALSECGYGGGTSPYISEQWSAGAKWSYAMPWYHYQYTIGGTHQYANSDWWQDWFKQDNAITMDEMKTLRAEYLSKDINAILSPTDTRDNAPETWYTISGTRVDSPRLPGIYISSKGRKVLKR